MYREYWGLKQLPFENVPDPLFFYAGEQYQEAQSRLLYAAESRKGAAMLVGDIGCGKTTLSRKLIQDLPAHRYDVALVVSPNLSPLEFLQEILYQFDPSQKSPSSRNEIKQLLNQRFFSSYERNRESLLIIDEAQILSFELLEEIRLLLNFQLNDRFLLTLILLGQPELQAKIDQHPQLAQRVAIRAVLRRLSLDETVQYIQSRIRKAEGNPALFSEDAFRNIFNVTEGVPRRINSLCDFALLVGANERRKGLDGEFVLRMADEVGGNTRKA